MWVVVTGGDHTDTKLVVDYGEPVIDRGGGDQLRVRIDKAIFLVELLYQAIDCAGFCALVYRRTAPEE